MTPLARAKKRYKDKIRREQPWIWHYWWAKDRCSLRPSSCNRMVYAERGIKFFLTKRQIKLLWLRDGAARMDKPSLDRKDSRLGYEFFNLRFIEFQENRLRALQGR